MRCLFALIGISAFVFFHGPVVGQQKSSSDHFQKAASLMKEFEGLPASVKFLSRFFGDKLRHAETELKSAREKDPGNLQGEFLWGVLMKNKLKLDEAEASLRKVASEDGRFSSNGFANVWLQLGQVYRESKKYDLSIDALKQGAVIDLTDTWPLNELAMVFLELGRTEEFTEAFMASLNDVRDSVKIQRLFIDARDIASKREMAVWDTLKLDSIRLDFLRTFWRKRDPNPINPTNERLIEHYKRLTFARQNYGQALSPWYDERGSIYIALGKPDIVYYGRSRQAIRENESWLYDRIKTGQSFDFVNMSGVYILTSLIDAAEQNARFEDVYELFNERAHLSGYYQQTAMKIRTSADVQMIRAQDQLNSAGSAGRSELLITALERVTRATYASDFLRTTDTRQDVVDNFAAASRQHFVFTTGAPHLPMNVNFAAFQSAGKKGSRFEFYYMVPFKTLSFLPDATQLGKYNSNVDLDVKFFDLKYNEVAGFTRSAALSGNSNEIQSHFFLDQVTQDLAPGKYIMAVEARNNEKDRVGIYQFVVNVRDYSGDTLTVSDIQLAQYVENTLMKDKFVKPQSTLKVIPNPAAGIVRTKPMTVYYEVYNLSLNDAGKSSYQVSYSIKLLEKDENFLSSIAGIFKSSKDASTSSVTAKEGKSRTEREYIGFDISELPAGLARLEIRVKDLLSGAETASAINLTIVEDEDAKTTVEKQ